MRFRNLFDLLAYSPFRNPAGRTRRMASRRRPGHRRLQLEALEDRCLLSFSPAVSYPVGINPQAVVTGDFNGDGKLDIAVANHDSNTVSILLGKGDGTFQPAQNFATGKGPQSLAAGDFNGDGKLDLVTVNAGDVSVLLGNGDGTFQAPHSIVLPGQFPPGYTGSTAVPQIPFSLTVGDVNGDGKLDLAVSGSTTFTNIDNHVDHYVNVLLGNGDGSFTPKATYHQSSTYSTVLGLADFNGDRKLDVVAVTTFREPPAGPSSGVDVWLGNGDGTLQAPVHSASGVGFNSVVTGDLNGDGKLDLVTTSGNLVLIQNGNGDGTFQAPQTLGSGLPIPYGYGTTAIQSVVLGDVNGDGKLDLTVLGSNTQYGGYGYYGPYNPTTTSYANVLLGHGDGSFTPPTSSTLGSRAGSEYFGAAALGDFNGAGRPDLAFTDSFANTVSVALNAADWSTTPQASSFTVSGFPSATTAGTAGNFTITAKKADGTTATAYTGTVHFSSSDPQAGLPADYTFIATDAGVHTFSATLKTAGTQSLTATDTTTASLTGCETGITVNPAAASHLGVIAPVSSTAGTAFSVTVTALDPYNNTATGYTGALHFTSSDPLAGLPGNYAFTTADAGMHAFSNGVILKTAGGPTVTATDTVTSSITGNAAVAVNAAAASTMTVAGFPSPITAGVAGTFTVTLKDIYGNIASGYTGTVHFTSSDGKASLPANYTFTAADAGVHTFSATLKTAGTQSMTATDTTTAGITGMDGGITVNPAAASKFIISAPASVTAGVAFSLTATVKDAYGNVVTGYTGTIHFTSTDSTATLPANYTFTAADKGVHTFTGLILRKRGNQKITIADTLNSSITGSVIENVL
jgi:hypothetical protein